MRPVGVDPTARVLTVLAALLAAVGAAASGLAVGEGSKTAVVLPVLVGVAIILGVLAFTAFGAYVMLMLTLRSSMDLFKLSSSSSGVATRGLDPSSLLEVSFLLAATLWLASQYRARGGLPGSRLRRALAVFAAAGLLSVVGSSDRVSSAVEALRIIAIVVMFAVLEQIMTDRQKMRRLLIAVFASLAFPLAYTILRIAAGSPPSEVKGSFTRITGPFGQSNTFGRFLMLMVIFGVAVLPHVHHRARLALGGTLGISIMFLVLTYTRTAILGAVIGVVVVACVQHRTKLVAGLGVAALCALLVVPQFASRFSDLSQTATQPGTPSGNSLDWRLGYWSEVLPLANANPITGIGLNMTQFQTDAAKQPHNDYIRAYVETGVVGLLAYLAMLVILIRTGWNAVRGSPRGSSDRAIAAGALGCAVAFVAASAFANVMSNVVVLWYLVAFAAAAAVIDQRNRRVDPAQVLVLPRSVR